MSVEAIPHKRSEVMSGKYVIQYLFAAGSSALVVPIIEAIGVGWTFTLCMDAFPSVCFGFTNGMLQVSSFRLLAGYWFLSLRDGDLICRDGPRDGLIWIKSNDANPIGR